MHKKAIGFCGMPHGETLTAIPAEHDPNLSVPGSDRRTAKEVERMYGKKL